MSSPLDKTLNVNRVYGSIVRRQPLLSKKNTAAHLEFAKNTTREEKRREEKTERPQQHRHPVKTGINTLPHPGQCGLV